MYLYVTVQLYNFELMHVFSAHLYMHLTFLYSLYAEIYYYVHVDATCKLYSHSQSIILWVEHIVRSVH